MSASALAAFEAHLSKAHEYRERAQWEFMTQELQEAKALCDSEQVSDAARRRREVTSLLGVVERRRGRYEIAKRYLDDVYEDGQASDAERMEVSGELSVIYRHLGDFAKAGEACSEQYRVARKLALKAEEEMCRAIGNLGMANYQLSAQNGDKELLHVAIGQLQERVQRARDLQARLLKEDPGSQSIRKARTWESIGIDRLTLCYAADGNTLEATRYGEMSRALTKDSPDPTVRAMSRFFCGYAWLRHGDRQRAADIFNFIDLPRDQCTSAIALCKEPSDEYCAYLKAVTSLRVDLEHCDEQGYSALDYAVFADHEPTQQAVLGGLQQTLGAADVTRLLNGAHLKKHYREIFQECLRPELAHRDHNGVERMRIAYAELLARDVEKSRLFDSFKFVSYGDFRKSKRLPSHQDNFVHTFDEARAAHGSEAFDPFVIFFSYRWLGTAAGSTHPCPDDADGTQYNRMCRAMNDFLEVSGIKPERLYIWLVCWAFPRLLAGIGALTT
jgi:tetratricopeptide (TPR) repeat protein